MKTNKTRGRWRSGERGSRGDGGGEGNYRPRRDGALLEGAGPAKALAQAASAAAAAAAVPVPPKRGLEALRRRKGLGLGPHRGWFKTDKC